MNIALFLKFGGEIEAYCEFWYIVIKLKNAQPSQVTLLQFSFFLMIIIEMQRYMSFALNS